MRMMRPSPMSSCSAAGEAGDDDVEEGDDAVDNGRQDGTNAVDDGHQHRADGSAK